eukprot:398437-Pleurochrysis_carterae.AAC.2
MLFLVNEFSYFCLEVTRGRTLPPDDSVRKQSMLTQVLRNDLSHRFSLGPRSQYNYVHILQCSEPQNITYRFYGGVQRYRAAISMPPMSPRSRVRVVYQDIRVEQGGIEVEYYGRTR